MDLSVQICKCLWLWSSFHSEFLSQDSTGQQGRRHYEAGGIPALLQYFSQPTLCQCLYLPEEYWFLKPSLSSLRLKFLIRPQGGRLIAGERNPSSKPTEKWFQLKQNVGVIKEDSVSTLHVRLLPWSKVTSAKQTHILFIVLSLWSMWETPLQTY